MIDFYRIPEDERDGIGIWIDIFKAEDRWHLYSENKKELNEQRKLRLIFHLKFIIWQLNIRIPLKHIGNTFYGRKMKE